MGFIKQITIQGFKSYKDQTRIEPFSAKSNIIVGRNGAGKSNFFAAVRFVLGDDYENMNREERQALLHEGAGSAVMSAYVEVVFDNADGRFHNSGRPEFVLRRTIGAKKDEYSMDRKNATKREVFEMLEAAGLSRSNPFYIVPQGRVTAITNMKDEERLSLLKEISGSNVYEKRRADSLKLLDDTDKKCERIDELVADINRRLQELEGEKKELEAWNKNDRERRALMFTLKQRQEARLEAELERIDSLRHHGAADVDQHSARFIQNEKDMADIDAAISELRSQVALLRDEREQVESDRRGATRRKAAVELELSELTDGQSAAQQAQRRRDAALKRVREEIQASEAELREIRPQYETKMDEETGARAQLAEAEGQRKRLEDKQGRTAFYTSKRQRDDALRQQIDDITVDLATRKSVQMQTADDMRERQQDIGRLEAAVSELEAKLEGEAADTLALEEQVQQARDAQQAVRDQQAHLFRDENRATSQLDSLEAQLRSAESELSNRLDHATSKGLDTLRRLQKQRPLPGVHGTVADLFEVPEPYKIAAEVSAGPSLFHVICDTDDTAAKMIDLLNKEKGGRLTFISLNQVQPRHVQTPQTADAQPLLPKLRYDRRYDKAFQRIFAKVVVCPDLSICRSLAATHDVLALTPDGDQAHKSGRYVGGYFNPSTSKLDAYHKVRTVREQCDQLRASNAEITAKKDRLRQKLTAAASELRKREHQKHHVESSYGPMRQELRTRQAELRQKRNALVEMQSTATQLAAAINELASRQNDLEAEISAAFTKALSKDEENQLASLAGTVKDLRRQVSTLTQERSELESRKTELEVELQENLRPNLDQLLAQQNGAGGSVKQSARLKECERALTSINKTVAEHDRRIAELNDQIEQANGQLEELEESRAGKERSNRELARAIEKQQKGMEKRMQQRTQYKEELAEVQRDIRELGTLPEEAYHKYARWSEEKVVNELEKANRALRQYSHVNKKAFEQYENFTKQRRHLNDRRTELSSSNASIQTLIQVLDQRKDEAIHRTFKQVSKYFQEVFVQLVPAGTGRLIIQRRSDREARRNADDSDDEEPATTGRSKTSVENYTGVGIAVSFNSKHDEQQRIQQLSGGQKALCALALVFAIQQCDPAPFYLFDEIDANLDAQYRTAVAEMLRKLSGKGGESGEGGGQFICTTFRPEMVLVADKCYAVSYSNSTSRIDVFDQEGALAFVETSQKG